MRIRLLHAILSGVIIAIVLGFSLIPLTWQIVFQEPTFGHIPNDWIVVGIIASLAIVGVTLLSFKFMKRAQL